MIKKGTWLQAMTTYWLQTHRVAHNLDSLWDYPSVPEEVNELTITDSEAVSGIAKEGQTLNASITPLSATADFKWERSTDGNTWTTIEGETSSRYTIKVEDAGSDLCSVATGTGFYNGEEKAVSSATAKGTPLAGSGAVDIV